MFNDPKMVSEKINFKIENAIIFGAIVSICEDDKTQTLRLSFLPQCIDIQIDNKTDAHLHDHFILTADISLHTIRKAEEQIDIEPKQCIKCTKKKHNHDST